MEIKTRKHFNSLIKSLTEEILDEEELDEELSSHLENVPFAGFGVTYLTNAMFALLALAAQDREMFIKKAENLTSIIYGRPQLFLFNYLQKGGKELSQGIISILYDLQD